MAPTANTTASRTGGSRHAAPSDRPSRRVTTTDAESRPESSSTHRRQIPGAHVEICIRPPPPPPQGDSSRHRQAERPSLNAEQPGGRHESQQGAPRSASSSRQEGRRRWELPLPEPEPVVRRPRERQPPPPPPTPYWIPVFDAARTKDDRTLMLEFDMSPDQLFAALSRAIEAHTAMQE